jgi:hypothetical protein
VPTFVLYYLEIVVIQACSLLHPHCRRGKRKQKHYTVFVATVAPLVQQHYYPNLNTAEHTSWKWFPWQELQQLLPLGKLHPVVEILLREHRAAVEAVVAASTGAG